jgi:hypothetical protein
MDEPRSELIYHVSLQSDDLSKTCKLGCSDVVAATFLPNADIDTHIRHYRDFHKWKVVKDYQHIESGELVRFVELEN